MVGVASFMHHMLQRIQVGIIKPIILNQIKIHSEIKDSVWLDLEGYIIRNQRLQTIYIHRMQIGILVEWIQIL